MAEHVLPRQAKSIPTIHMAKHTIIPPPHTSALSNLNFRVPWTDIITKIVKAPKRAENRLTWRAMLPNGTKVASFARRVSVGEPTGGLIPRRCTTVTNSAASRRYTRDSPTQTCRRPRYFSHSTGVHPSCSLRTKAVRRAHRLDGYDCTARGARQTYLQGASSSPVHLNIPSGSIKIR